MSVLSEGLSIFTCNKRTDKTYKSGKTGWKELCEKLENPTVTKETTEEYFALKRPQQDEIKDVGGFVLGKLKGGSRKKENVISRSGISLDLDYAPFQFYQEIEFPYAYAIYTTRKHTKEKPRYRMIIPLSRDVRPDEYEAISRWVSSNFGMNIDWFDPTTFEPNRMMYWPSCSSDALYELRINEEPFLEPDEILGRMENWQDASTWAYPAREQARIENLFKKVSDPTLRNDPVGFFCRAYSIEEAIETFIPDVYVRSDVPDRWTYTKGTSSNGLIEYGNHVYSHHSTDPANDGHCHNAFDLVRLHLFRTLDDKQPDLVGANQPSFQAMLEHIEEDERFKREQAVTIFGEIADRMEDDFSEITKEEYLKESEKWRDLLERDVKGRISSSYSNIKIILENDPKLKGLGTTNELKGRVYKTASLPWWRFDKENSGWSDADTDHTIEYLENYGIKKDEMIKRAIRNFHDLRRIHPVREYLKSLTWDGIPRVDLLLIDYMGAKDSEYHRVVARRTLVGAVKRIMEPGCKFDTVLMLRGDQGIGKSEMVRRLLPDRSWVSDTLDSLEGKDAYDQISGFSLVEISENVALNKSEAAKYKNFLSKPVDDYRKPYGREVLSRPRQCIFIATTNEPYPLKDLTGDRRFWPVNCVKGRESVWEDLPLERDQIWAEAYQMYEAGERTYLDEHEEALAEEERSSFTFVSVLESEITNYLNEPKPKGWSEWSRIQRRLWLDNPEDLEGKETETINKVCVGMIGWDVLNDDPKKIRKGDQLEIGMILRKNGFENGPVSRFPEGYGRQRSLRRKKR